MDVQTALNRHIPAMVGILKSASPALVGHPQLERFINRIRDDFEHIPRERHRRTLPGEDIFWWCLGILEMFSDDFRPDGKPSETAVRGGQIDAFMAMQLQELRDMAPLLERREALPGGRMVGWLDDLDDEFDDEFDECFGDTLIRRLPDLESRL